MVTKRRGARGRSGLVLVEIVITMAILAFMITVVYGLMGNARTIFFDMSMGTQLRDGLRQAVSRMELELRNTGYDSAHNAQFLVSAGAGASGTDTIRFSVPILCSTTATLLNASGDPANWGAGLTWGCGGSACMDANNSCAVLEYKYIKYAVNSSGQLVRSVLGPDLATVGSAVIGRDISGLSITFNNATRTLSLVVKARKLSGTSRMVTETVSQNVRLMN